MAKQPTLKNISHPYYTDVILQEREDYLSRDVAPVTTAAAVTLPQGAIVFRAKGTDPAATYAPVTAASQIALANEFAILIGNDFEAAVTEIDFEEDVATKCILLTREARAKEESILKAVKVSFAAITEAQFASLKEVLRQQDLLIETTAPKVSA